jgi:hypothetical protein
VATGYTALVPVTSVQLWDAIYRLGADDLLAEDIGFEVIAKLIEFKMVQLNAVDLPQLTPYGATCFTVLMTGSGEVPELKDMAAIENQQRPGNGQRVE